MLKKKEVSIYILENVKIILMVTDKKKTNTTPKNPQTHSVMWGFAYSIRRKDGSWAFHLNWGRIGLLVCGLAILGWCLLAGVIYGVFKYQRKYSDMTVKDAFLAPFDMKAHREKVGNYNIRTAMEIFKSGNPAMFSEAFMHLNSGVNRAPKNIMGRIQLARIYVAMGRQDVAIQYLEQGIIFCKEDIDFIRLYMRLLLDRIEDVKIVNVGEKLLRDGKIENPQVKAYIAMTLSSVYAMHGDYSSSEKYLKEYNLGKTLPGILRLSKNEWEMGNREEAIKIISENFKYPKNKDPMYALLVNYYTAMGDYDTARKYSVLRSAENPFSMAQKIEHIRLLDKSGDKDIAKKLVGEFFEANKLNHVAMVHLANFVADKGDIDMMRKIYDNSVLNGFPSGTYCLLLLETMITNGDHAGAVKFSEEILRGKPSWIKRHEDVLSSLRAIAYYATGNKGEADVLLKEVQKRPRISPKVLVATARRFDSLDAPMIANAILLYTVERFPRYQTALIRLVQNELKLGDSSNIDKHVVRLIRMRRPPRELISSVFDNIVSDRFIFMPDREKILKEVESLKVSIGATFSDVIEDDAGVATDNVGGDISEL